MKCPQTNLSFFLEQDVALSSALERDWAGGGVGACEAMICLPVIQAGPTDASVAAMLWIATKLFALLLMLFGARICALKFAFVGQRQ